VGGSDPSGSPTGGRSSSGKPVNRRVSKPGNYRRRQWHSNAFNKLNINSYLAFHLWQTANQWANLLIKKFARSGAQFTINHRA